MSEFNLHPRQSLAFLSKATEILYGGAAGGGKSYFFRIAAVIWCGLIPGLQVYLFRRIREDLVKNHMEGESGFQMLLAPLVQSKHVQIVEDEIRFWNGSKIYLCHCKDEKDRLKYLGAEIHVLIIDELTTFTEKIYRFLRSRVRMSKDMKIPEKYKDCFPRILSGSNPGGIGHQFVKAAFIDPRPQLEIWKTPKKEGGFLRQFIPAKLTDNPSLDYESYSSTLSGLGNDELVRAMLEGDWDVVAGAALKIDRDKHGLRPFKPLDHWVKFQVIDWGYAKPYCVSWFCVPDEDTILAETDDYPEKLLPKGALIMYREHYGIYCNDDGTIKPDMGIREESDIVARKIIKIEDDAMEKMDYRVADTAMWSKNDGPSIYERMYKATKGRFNPRQSIKDRQANYSEICSRLKGIEIEKGNYVPMLYFTNNCIHFWRTVPTLVLDENQPEKGPDTDQEDHSYDTVSYGCMSRPFILTERQRINSDFFKKRAKHNLDRCDPYQIKPQKRA
jgi:hypothetical protein